MADVRAALPQAAGGLDEVVARLHRAGLIQRPGTPAAPSFGESGTLTAWLHVSNACNLACPYCYVHKSAAAMDERTVWVPVTLSQALTWCLLLRGKVKLGIWLRGSLALGHFQYSCYYDSSTS